MKKILAFALAAILLVPLFSCSAAPSYKTDVAVQTLASAAEPAISQASNLANASDEYLEFFLEVDPALYDDAIVRTPTGALSIDEYAIFRAKSEADAAAIRAALETYLTGRRSSWDGRYNASEKPKLDNAKCFTYGSYVGYTILSQSEESAFLSALENALRG